MTNQERIQANNTELQECIELAESLPNAGGDITPSGTLEITENGEYDVTEYASANVSVEDLLQYATFNNGRLFNGCIFPEDKRDVHFKVKGTNSNNGMGLTGIFSYSNIKTLILSIETEDAKITINSLCSTCLYLTEFTFNGNYNLYNINSIFFECQNLKTINGKMNISNVANSSGMNNAFAKCYALEDIEFVENTIRLSINFAHCNLLSDKSIQSIIDGLAEVGTTQTLTLHADVKAKLTQTQLDAITSKNWNLA